MKTTSIVTIIAAVIAVITTCANAVLSDACLMQRIEIVSIISIALILIYCIILLYMKNADYKFGISICEEEIQRLNQQLVFQEDQIQYVKNHLKRLENKNRRRKDKYNKQLEIPEKNNSLERQQSDRPDIHITPPNEGVKKIKRNKRT